MADVKSIQDKVAADKISRLTKYAEHIKSRISAAVPERHAGRVEAYKAWLKLELKRTTAKMEKLRG